MKYQFAKYIGIALMICAHFIGTLSGNIMNEVLSGLQWEVYAAYVAAGSIEAFIAGAIILLVGIRK